MRSRRQLLRLSFTALLAYGLGDQLAHGHPASPAVSSALRKLYLPLVLSTPPADLSLLGPPSGTARQAFNWLSRRATGYTVRHVATIVDIYRGLGEAVGVDWFLALAQLAHETGSLTSWWSQRPRRNPAGIAVTGAVRRGQPDKPPDVGWTWDGTQWREGFSFLTWRDDAVPAHLGRLLAYALHDVQATPAQRDLIARALSFRAMPERHRGVAPTICGLNGRWAVPGTTYGQRIVKLTLQMRTAL